MATTSCWTAARARRSSTTPPAIPRPAAPARTGSSPAPPTRLPTSALSTRRSSSAFEHVIEHLARVLAGGPKPGRFRPLLDLINRPARIAGDKALLLAIHQQVQAFQDHGADQGRLAFRLDDGRKRVVTAEQF